MTEWTNDVVLESHRVHRARLMAAFLGGPAAGRRAVGTNGKRFIWSIIAAAAIGVGCVGYAVVAPAIAAALGLT